MIPYVARSRPWLILVTVFFCKPHSRIICYCPSSFFFSICSSLFNTSASPRSTAALRSFISHPCCCCSTSFLFHRRLHLIFVHAQRSFAYSSPPYFLLWRSPSTCLISQSVGSTYCHNNTNYHYLERFARPNASHNNTTAMYSCANYPRGCRGRCNIQGGKCNDCTVSLFCILQMQPVCIYISNSRPGPQPAATLPLLAVCANPRFPSPRAVRLCASGGARRQDHRGLNMTNLLFSCIQQSNTYDKLFCCEQLAQLI